MPLRKRVRIYRRRGIAFLCSEVIIEVVIGDMNLMNFVDTNRSAKLS